MSNDPGDKPPDKPSGEPSGEPSGKPPGAPPGRSPFAPPAASGSDAPRDYVAAPGAPPVQPPAPYVEPPSESAVVGHHAPIDYQPAQFPRPTEESAAPYNPYGPPPGSAPPGPGPGYGTGAPPYGHPGAGPGPGPGPGVSPNAQHPYTAMPPQAYGYAPPPPFPGVLWFCLLLLIGFLGQIVVTIGGAIVATTVLESAGPSGNIQNAFLNLPAAVIMGILLLSSLSWPAVALVTAQLKKMLNRDTFRLHWPGLPISTLAAVLGLALVPLALLLENLMARVVPRGDNFIITIMAKEPGVLALTLLGLTLVVAAPVGEELLFRGLGYRGIERRYGLGLSALAISLLFAAVHMNATGFVALFMVSMALCWVTTKTGSLLPAILLHAAYNGVQFLMLLASDLTPEAAEKASKSTDLGMPLWVFPAGLVISLACLFAIGKLSDTQATRRAVD